MSPALPVDSLLSKPPGKPMIFLKWMVGGIKGTERKKEKFRCYKELEFGDKNLLAN